MCLLDIILAIPLCYCIYKGFKRGIIFELAALVGVIVGCFAAIHFSRLVAKLIGLQGEWALLIAFLITFIGVVALSFFLGKCIENLIKLAKAGILNKLLGAVLGMIKCVCIVSVLLNFVLLADPGKKIITEQTQEKSILFKPVHSVGNRLTSQLKTYVTEYRNNKK